MLGRRSVGVRRGMGIRWCMGVTVGFAMGFTVSFVHAFMEDLGLIPGVLVTRGGGEDQDGGGKEDGGGFHEKGVRGD
ncbi:hypothetical protein EI77_04302 [Prosthecobacter fusiformis]|uniref:Uncharacterized protein n=1 Tax=Prosthecobacter fusiformis TaxID=48464 RepID=A0A4R7RJ34_9BACT|nr:hypothetical protein EI77_04302 [Prosthecobacter fusiformis]